MHTFTSTDTPGTNVRQTLIAKYGKAVHHVRLRAGTAVATIFMATHVELNLAPQMDTYEMY